MKRNPRNLPERPNILDNKPVGPTLSIAIGTDHFPTVACAK